MKNINYDGVCPICGSRDGIIVLGDDGKYRNICRVFNCFAHYIPTPSIGFENENDCRNPLETSLVKNGISYEEYIFGKKE